MVINSKHVTNVDHIAGNIKYFFEIVPKFSTNMEVSSIDLKSYVQKYETVQSERDLTVNELKEAFFFCLRQDFRYNGINFNVTKTCFGPLIKP